MMMLRLIKTIFILVAMTFKVGAQEDTLELQEQLDILLNGANTPGAAISVSKNGEPIFTYYSGSSNLQLGHTIGENTLFRMASVTKQITAHAIYSLIESGQLASTTLLSELFPNWPREFKKVQIHHLLEHCSGLPDYEDMIALNQKRQLTDQDVMDLIVQRPVLKFTPGEYFSYSNTGYCLLALVVQKITSGSFANFVKTAMFEPIGIKRGLIYSPQSIMNDRAYGYHPTDSAVYFADQSITSATQGDGGAYLGTLEIQKWCTYLISRLSTDHSYQLAFNDGTSVTPHVRYQFGLFNFIDKNKNMHLFHSGESTGFQNIIYIDVHSKLAITIFTNRDDFIISDIFDKVVSFYGYGQLLDSTLGKPAFHWLNDIYEGAY